MSDSPDAGTDNTKQLKWIAVAVLASAGPIAFAQRDLKKRPKDQIRGPKLFWRLWAFNGLGAVSYLKFGRKEVEAGADD